MSRKQATPPRQAVEVKGEGLMRRFQVTLVAAFALAAMAGSAHADTQQTVLNKPTPHPNATLIARHYKCGGEELQCDSALVRVCNPKNGKCCCAAAGTYH